MKKILLLFVAIAVSACSDDDTSNVYNGDMNGTWKIMSYKRPGQPIEYTTECDNVQPDQDYAPLISYVFTSNEMEGYYTCNPDFEHIDFYAYNFANGVLTMTSPNDTVKANITSLGDNSIGWKYTYATALDNYDGPYMVLEKQ